MHNIIYPTKDAWIYSSYPTYNYGSDEILELRKDETGSLVNSDYSRILMQFDTASFSTKAVASASHFYLNLYAANPLDLASDYTIEAYPVSQSWTVGTGFPAGSKIKYDGVSWSKKSENTGWNVSGSDFIRTLVSASQVFSYDVADVRMDVTTIVRAWTSGTLPNYGFVIKRPDNEETSSTDYGRLTFYSMNTHTVTLPTLEAVWDDSVYVTGSIQLIYSGSMTGYITDGTIIGTFESSSGITVSGSTSSSFSNSKLTITSAIVSSSSDMTVTGSVINALPGQTLQPILSDQLAIVMKNLKSEYKYNTTTRIRLAGKDQYQRKLFSNTASSRFSEVKYLPVNNCWYSVVDAYTNRIIIPFSDYTKLSCDLNGNYFDLCLSGFMPMRFYKILFKVNFDSADSYFDNNYIFKVVK